MPQVIISVEKNDVQELKKLIINNFDSSQVEYEMLTYISEALISDRTAFLQVIFKTRFPA